MSIADNIKLLREQHSLTQSELGKIAGVTDKAVWAWEQGGKIPRMGVIQKMADYFGVSTSSLIDGGNTANSIRIKVYSSVHAGIPIEAQSDIIDWEDIPREWTMGNKEYFGVRVTGDCMTPKYHEGDTVIIRVQPDCESGQDCIVYVNGYDAELRKVVKQTGAIILQPLNSEYLPDKYYYNDPEHPVTIVGVVVEIRRKV
jgi:repressor LexA